MRNVLAILGTVLAACGGGEEMRDAGGDAGTDAGTQPADGGNPGTDAGADAGPECAPSEMRTVDCGNCGLAQQVCSAEGMWLAPGTCMAEGECAVAEVDMETTDRCGMRSRICDDTCHWRDWTVMVPDGECAAGETVREASATCTVSEVLERQCSSSCVLDVGTCVDACGGTRRTTPADAEEVCIPAGPFIRGTDAFANTQPVAEVQMSAYYIDRFPVTNDRYRACVSAGACTLPTNLAGLTSYNDAARGRYPVQDVSHTAAAAFCTWDGGRALPSEAQWEKAARGPAPATNPYPWGSTFQCSYVLCTSSQQDMIPHEVGSLPESQSIYGLDLMLGGGREWTQDFYDSAYYDRPESLGPDPANTTSSTQRTLRGVRSGGTATMDYHVSRRASGSNFPPPASATLRCARPAP
ncbi:MAG: formylglycine-generating enzyme family protein [Sandaracinaceae bacterium]|nr:formylglycine-generating enzyme family protein [Sandaracinaceae bacterium]